MKKITKHRNKRARGDYVTDEPLNLIKDKYGKVITFGEIKGICKLHRLGRLKKIINVQGKTNVVIIVKTNKGKFILKFYTFPPARTRLKYVENVILQLKKAGIPVISAIKNKKRDYLTFINGRLVQVYPFINGYQFQFNHKQITSSAFMLKRFHGALSLYKNGPLPSYSNFPSKENLEKKLVNLIKLREKYMTEPSSLIRIEFLYHAVMMRWDRVNTEDLPIAIIHDDWHPWNQIYCKNGQVKTILDYDGVQQGLRIYDIAYALYTIMISSPNNDKKMICEMFLKGYGELTNKERQILPLVVAKVALFFILRSPKKAEEHLIENESFILSLLGEGEEHILIN